MKPHLAQLCETRSWAATFVDTGVIPLKRRTHFEADGCLPESRAVRKTAPQEIARGISVEKTNQQNNTELPHETQRMRGTL